jgi:hypothetical protein
MKIEVSKCTYIRQVKEKKTQQTQKKTQQYRKLNKLSTRTQPTIGG